MVSWPHTYEYLMLLYHWTPAFCSPGEKIALRLLFGLFCFYALNFRKEQTRIVGKIAGMVEFRH